MSTLLLIKKRGTSYSLLFPQLMRISVLSYSYIKELTHLYVFLFDIVVVVASHGFWNYRRVYLSAVEDLRYALLQKCS